MSTPAPAPAPAPTPAPTGHESDLEASAKALEVLTSDATRRPVDPKEHFHCPANHESSHHFLSRFFPSSARLERLEAEHHMGNYVMDRSTGAKSFEAMSIYVRVGMHLLYYGSVQENLLHTRRVEALLKAQSEKMGLEYDDPASRAHIRPFIASFGLQDSLAELAEPDPDRYRTFNDFFAREVRADARPVADPDDDRVTSSPADCRLTAFPTVDLATRYWIKGRGFTLARLLGSEPLARELDGGGMVIARLAPQDYHRWHAPVSGTVESVAEIPGTYYTVNPQAINQPGTVDVFCENRRSVMVVRRAATGRRVAIVAVGAMLVGSIRYVGGVERPGAQMRRGQCLGAFYYGGSTVIVVYPRDEVRLDQDLVRNSTEENCETTMKVGWRTGTSQ